MLKFKVETVVMLFGKKRFLERIVSVLLVSLVYKRSSNQHSKEPLRTYVFTNTALSISLKPIVEVNAACRWR